MIGGRNEMSLSRKNKKNKKEVRKNKEDFRER